MNTALMGPGDARHLGRAGDPSPPFWDLTTTSATTQDYLTASGRSPAPLSSWNPLADLHQESFWGQRWVGGWEAGRADPCEECGEAAQILCATLSLGWGSEGEALAM